ncbi:hypothetical protein [Chloroflexus sp.]|uniref:hypothetical protein n=1 Tax=Chloroflexus sp. TaxID=1904827 RepID=UPI002ADDCD02|nr:hypothetical protein [Chloroflexus sp.]
MLPDQIALIGAGLVLALGAVGYFRWRQATGVVRALWRVQVGWLVMLLFLNLLALLLLICRPLWCMRWLPAVQRLGCSGPGLWYCRRFAMPGCADDDGCIEVCSDCRRSGVADGW